MKKSIILVCSIILLSVSGVVTATNIALNSTVTFHDGSLYTGARDQAPLSSLTDGLFQDPSLTWWDDGTVSWLYRENHATYGVNGYIKFDLGGIFTIDSFIAELDDNDAYILSYWNMTLNQWSTAWDIPNYDSLGFGMTTRPNPSNNTQAYALGSTITTNALRLEGSLTNGDGNFAVSELQAFGELYDDGNGSTGTIPEPATLALMGLGLAGIGYRRKAK